MFDLIVLGAGPGGYVAAIRASQLGLKVAIVDKRKTLGGTCLNVGCIPSKALLHSSHMYHEAKHTFKDHGVVVDKVDLDLNAFLAQKDKTVDELTKGIAFLMRKNKIEVFEGEASFLSPTQIAVKNGKDSQTLDTKNVIIATGSVSADIPGIDVDEKNIVSSTGALALEKVPQKMVVIGAGYIGLEMASVWGRLGTEVTVVEYLDRITPTMDAEMATALQKTLTKQGMKFMLGHKVLEAKNAGGKVTLKVAANSDNKEVTLESDVVLVSVGRRPSTSGLDLDKIGVKVNNRGFIITDEHLRTSQQNIYAIGDVVEGPMLAHKASEEGIAVAERLTGQHGHVNYNLIPGVIYTNPEVAAVGLTEEQLKAENKDYKVGKFPFTANSRAKATGETDGLAKVLADPKTDRVLGIHIMGPQAGTMIAEAAGMMALGASAEDIARTCHAHPTFNEALLEAALAVDKRALHI